MHPRLLAPLSCVHLPVGAHGTALWAVIYHCRRPSTQAAAARTEHLSPHIARHKDASGIVCVLQELGPRYARNVKVSMEEMRKKQSDAACAVLRRQATFLARGQLPEGAGAYDPATLPVGQLDEQSQEVLQLRPDGEEDEAGAANGQMRIRRRITYARPGRGQPVTRTIFFTTRTDIFNVNSLCEKWVRVPVPRCVCIRGGPCCLSEATCELGMDGAAAVVETL